MSVTVYPDKLFEDVAHVSGDPGIQVLTVRDDTLDIKSGAEGDYEPQHSNENGALWVQVTPSSKGGWDSFNATSGDGSTALTSTAQSVKASAGLFGGYYVYNPNATVAYLIVYNTASGSVTVGTTTPKLVFAIPAGSAANLELTNGITFGTAIVIAATSTAAGNGAPTSALECLIWYK